MNVLLLGGAADRQVVTVLHGSSVIMGDPATGERQVYEVVYIRGITKEYALGVPSQHALDGEWVVQRLLADYAGRPWPW